MFSKSKVSQSMIDAVKSVVDVAEAIKIPTATGTKVLGGSYGNSAKAHQDQTKKDIDTLKGPKTKELSDIEKPVKEELKGNQDKIDANHNDKIDSQDFKILRNKKKVKEDFSFASRLLAHAKLAEEVEEELNEVLSKDATAGDWIHDFVHSDNPKFAGKSKAERKKMALGAYYAKQNEAYEDSAEDKKEDAKEAKKRGMTLAQWEKSAEDKKQDKEEMKESAYELADGPVTTDTLAGRENGGQSNNFKSFKLRVKPLDKEGQDERTPKISEPEMTARKPHIGHGGEVEIKKGEVVGTVHKEEVELTEHTADFAKQHGFSWNRDTYGATMSHPKHGHININRYGEWTHHTEKGAGGRGVGIAIAHGGDQASLQHHLGGLHEATEAPKKNTDVADKSWLKDAGKKPTIKGDIKNFGRFLAGKKETNESKTLSPGQDDAPFEQPYTTTPANVKDKSGAVHTPMSRAKDLARSAMKKVKTEMLGKTGTSE